MVHLLTRTFIHRNLCFYFFLNLIVLLSANALELLYSHIRGGEKKNTMVLYLNLGKECFQGLDINSTVSFLLFISLHNDCLIAKENKKRRRKVWSAITTSWLIGTSCICLFLDILDAMKVQWFSPACESLCQFLVFHVVLLLVTVPLPRNFPSHQ